MKVLPLPSANKTATAPPSGYRQGHYDCTASGKGGNAWPVYINLVYEAYGMVRCPLRSINVFRFDRCGTKHAAFLRKRPRTTRSPYLMQPIAAPQICTIYVMVQLARVRIHFKRLQAMNLALSEYQLGASASEGRAEDGEHSVSLKSSASDAAWKLDRRLLTYLMAYVLLQASCSRVRCSTSASYACRTSRPPGVRNAAAWYGFGSPNMVCHLLRQVPALFEQGVVTVTASRTLPEWSAPWLIYLREGTQALQGFVNLLVYWRHANVALGNTAGRRQFLSMAVCCWWPTRWCCTASAAGIFERHSADMTEDEEMPTGTA